MYFFRVAAGISAACAAISTIGAVFAAQFAAPAPRDTPALLAQQTIARQLSRGEEHRYQLSLDAGECARVIVEQQGIDVVVRVRRPEQEAPIVEVQDDILRRGQETVDVVADRAGIYTLGIAPAPGIITLGDYAIRLDTRHQATAADRSRQEARMLRTAAAQRADLDDFAGAATLLEQALTLTENLPGSNDREVADVAAQLADVYLDKRDTARAEPLYQRALAILDRTVGSDHPTPASIRSRLARLYQLTGERVK